MIKAHFQKELNKLSANISMLHAIVDPDMKVDKSMVLTIKDINALYKKLINAIEDTPKDLASSVVEENK